jgi:hypothetical protein
MITGRDTQDESKAAMNRRTPKGRADAQAFQADTDRLETSYRQRGIRGRQSWIEYIQEYSLRMPSHRSLAFHLLEGASYRH